MKVGYARVSTKEQELNRQIDALVAFGIDKRNIYKEKASGTNKNRPELNRMLEELQDGDLIVVHELNRISRRTKDLFDIVEQIKSKNAAIKSISEDWLDTTTPQGELIFTIFAALSQFERDQLSNRIKEGLAAAKARGRVGGRPRKRTDKAPYVLAMYQNGEKKSAIIKATGLSRSTIDRIVKEHEH